MFRIRHLSFALVLAAAFALAVAGCSSDPVSSPGSKALPQSVLTKQIGPSEIVLCLDLSDSTSGEELDAMIAALGACLSDAEQIPQDGNVALSAIVYGDTAIALLDTAVVVTAESLESEILPALQGLASDRLVGGGGHDLSGALTLASDLLGASVRPDLHILVVGGPDANDPAAVETVRDDIAANTGVMISAIAWTDQTADLLAGLAEATGGHFAAAGADPAATCARTLAYMLVVEIDLSPESGTLSRGEEHSLTALVFRGGDPDAFPIVGQDASISVVEGPNTGAAIATTTDTLGALHFAYTGSGGAGTDVIVALTDHPGTGVALSDTVSVTWANQPPVCDAGGPYFLEVTADTMSLALDASGSYDADGDSLTFSWQVDIDWAWVDDATSMQPTLTLTDSALCADTLTIRLTVEDGWDASTCETQIVLQDLRPAVIELVEPALQLWPVNGKHVRVTPDQLVASITDACGRELDLDGLFILEVSSDEPEDSIGDGNTLDDIVIDCPADVLLRAERMGGERGRVYTIVYGFEGNGGQVQTFTAIVEVPHDQSGVPVIPNVGMGYTVTADCAAAD